MAHGCGEGSVIVRVSVAAFNEHMFMGQVS